MLQKRLRKGGIGFRDSQLIDARGGQAPNVRRKCKAFWQRKFNRIARKQQLAARLARQQALHG